MLVNIGDKPPGDFTRPIDLMKDCHRRIEHFLGVLGKVEQQLGDSKLTAEGQRALRSAVHYFSEFAPRHTADEEGSLFPRLRSSGSSEAAAVLDDMDHLEADHRTAEEGHAVLDRLAGQWLATGTISPADRALWQSTLTRLTEIYAAHIELEEQRVFELATRVLATEQLREIGDEMKQRRA